MSGPQLVGEHEVRAGHVEEHSRSHETGGARRHRYRVNGQCPVEGEAPAAPGAPLLELGDRVFLARDPLDTMAIPGPDPAAGDIDRRRRGPGLLGHERGAARDCERQTGDQERESSHELLLAYLL
jgi:hypothetical protein